MIKYVVYKKQKPLDLTGYLYSTYFVFQPGVETFLASISAKSLVAEIKKKVAGKSSDGFGNTITIRGPGGRREIFLQSKINGP